MAARTVQKLSPKTVQKRVDVWKREFPEIYAEIEMLARETGILTKTGKISQAKRNKKKFEKFSEQFQTEFGSFSQFKKKEKEKYAQARADETTTASSWKEHVRERKNLNDMIHELFDFFDNSDDAYAIYKEVQGMSIGEQKDFIKDQLQMIKSNKKKEQEKFKKQFKNKKDVEELFDKKKPKTTKKTKKKKE